MLVQIFKIVRTWGTAQVIYTGNVYYALLAVCVCVREREERERKLWRNTDSVFIHIIVLSPAFSVI